MAFQTATRHTAAATQADVRRIALALPDVEEGEGHFAFSVRTRGKLKGFAWVWMERIEAKKPRVANPSVLAVRFGTLAEKETLISVEPTKFFTEPHYNGFPAVLVRLAAVRVPDLRILLEAAWRCQATTGAEKRRSRASKRPRR